VGIRDNWILLSAMGASILVNLVNRRTVISVTRPADPLQLFSTRYVLSNIRRVMLQRQLCSAGRASPARPAIFSWLVFFQQNITARRPWGSISGQGDNHLVRDLVQKTVHDATSMRRTTPRYQISLPGAPCRARPRSGNDTMLRARYSLGRLAH
jgi:hypothetical protein